MFNPGDLETTRKYEVCCPNCKKNSPLSSWGFVQTHQYESPHGCSGGDTWWKNEDIMTCLLVCPHLCSGDGNSLAFRVLDLPINRQERDWVFGLIKKETQLWEDGLLKIFADHFVQYRERDGIENSKTKRKRLEEIDF